MEHYGCYRHIRLKRLCDENLNKTVSLAFSIKIIDLGLELHVLKMERARPQGSDTVHLMERFFLLSVAFSPNHHV